ncbi:response regulator [Candidatus Omnitrophota bacterium]
MEKPYKILLAFEDKQLSECCKNSLTDSYLVYVVNDAKRVYEIVHEVQLDLAILDYNLPNINPIELHEGMEYLHPATTIILCTTEENEQVAKRIWHRRALDYIRKPFHVSGFVNEVNKILRYVVACDQIRTLEQRVLRLERELKNLREEN